jgi:hypothetical protein
LLTDSEGADAATGVVAVALLLPPFGSRSWPRSPNS